MSHVRGELMKLPLLLKQTGLRSGAILIVKTIGLVGRISLTRLVGAEGVGLYQIAYSVFGLALMALSGGFPTALALFTAKNDERGWLYFKRISIYLFVTAGGLGLAACAYSGTIARLLGSPDLHTAIRTLAPALLVVPVLGLLRGYLQGQERYGLIALSEIVEQATRVFSMLLIVVLLLPYGYPAAVGGGMLGTCAGALLAFAFLTWRIAGSHIPQAGLASSPAPPATAGSEMSWLIQTSLAIALTRILVPFSDFLDAMIIPNRLQAAGYGVSEAIAVFGVIAGMAAIVVYMPTFVTAALSHTMTMKMAADWKLGRMESFLRRSRIAMDLSWTSGCASGFFLYLFAPELSRFIFGTAEATDPIRYLAVIPLIAGYREMTTSILWAQDRKRTPLVGLAIGIGVAAVIHYAAIPLPGFGILGIVAGTIAMEMTAVVWNASSLRLGPFLRRRLAVMAADVVGLGCIMLIAGHLSEALSVRLPSVIGVLLGMLAFGAAAVAFLALRYIRVWRSA